MLMKDVTRVVLELCVRGEVGYHGGRNIVRFATNLDIDSFRRCYGRLALRVLAETLSSAH